jgi:restriction endonuclease Mrr
MSIDGMALMQHLVEHRFTVFTDQSYIVHGVNNDYFEANR